MTKLTIKGDDFIVIQKRDKPTDWKDFKLAADIDFSSFYMLYHVGIIPMGTVGWLLQQAVEKYSKAVLNKANPEKYTEEYLRKKFGHHVERLWSEIFDQTSQFDFQPSYHKLIEQLVTVTTDTRYLNYMLGTSIGLIDVFTILCCEFRYEILGNEQFHSKFFGLENAVFFPKFFLENASAETMFKRLMHFFVEHGVAMSAAGIPDICRGEMSRASAKFCQCGRYPEIERECPMCQKRIWHNQQRSPDDARLLKEFFWTL